MKLKDLFKQKKQAKQAALDPVQLSLNKPKLTAEQKAARKAKLKEKAFNWLVVSALVNMNLTGTLLIIACLAKIISGK